jgi:hypothetical protein
MTTTTTPSVFTPNPSSQFLGVIDIDRTLFSQLPDHPAQRQTALHAINLLSYGVLNDPLDQHRDVEVLLIGEPATGRTIEAMVAAFQENPQGAIKRFGHKLNGHTRGYIWEKSLLPAPITLRAFVRVATDRRSAVQVYNAVDSLVSVKSRKDVMQSTLNVAGIHPVSDLLQKSGVMAPALDLASGVLFGSFEYRARHLLQITGNVVRDQADDDLHALLPHLAAVRVFKPAILALDTLNLLPKVLPAKAPFVGAYLSILHRDPDEGLCFLQALRTEAGASVGGLMDSFFTIRAVFEYLNEGTRRSRSSPAQRAMQIMYCVLNTYAGWKVQGDAYRTEGFPLRKQVIAQFNPGFKHDAEGWLRTALAERAAAKERRMAEQAERRAIREHGTAQAAPLV